MDGIRNNGVSSFVPNQQVNSFDNPGSKETVPNQPAPSFDGITLSPGAAEGLTPRENPVNPSMMYGMFPEIPVPGEHEQPQLPTDGPKPEGPNPSMMYGMFPEIPVPGEHEQPQLPTDGPKPGVPNPSMMYGMFPSLPTPGENKIPGDFEFPEGLKPDAEPHNMYGVFFPHDPIGGGQKIELLGGQEEKPNTLGFDFGS